MKNELGVLGLAAVFAAQAGCGFASGDIEVYRVTIAQGTYDGDCGEEEEETTFASSAVWTLMAHDANGELTYLLDTGGQVLTGIETDAGYLFNGRAEFTETIDEDLGVEFVLAVDETITISADSSQMSGDIARIVTSKCTGDDLFCEDFDDTKCTIKIAVVGVRADEEAEAVSPPVDVESE